MDLFLKKKVIAPLIKQMLKLEHLLLKVHLKLLLLLSTVANNLLFSHGLT